MLKQEVSRGAQTLVRSLLILCQIHFFYAMTFVFFGKVISIIKPRAPKQEIVEEINDNVDDELIEA